MKHRKILLIVLVVLVLAALMYKMSERYTPPANVEEIVRKLSSDLNLSNAQTQVVAYVFMNGTEPPPELREIDKTITNEKRVAIQAELSKYMPPKPIETVKKFVPPNVMGFSCSKLPNNNRFMCSFS